MNVCYGIKPNVSGFEVISKWMFHDIGLICEHLEKSKPKKRKKKNWKTLYGVPILYTVKKGGDGGGGGEVRGAFEQVLRGHIFHVTLFSIALQSGLFKPSSFFRHFFNLSLFFLWTVYYSSPNSKK